MAAVVLLADGFGGILGKLKGFGGGGEVVLGAGGNINGGVDLSEEPAGRILEEFKQRSGRGFVYVVCTLNEIVCGFFVGLHEGKLARIGGQLHHHGVVAGQAREHVGNDIGRAFDDIGQADLFDRRHGVRVGALCNGTLDIGSVCGQVGNMTAAERGAKEQEIVAVHTAVLLDEVNGGVPVVQLHFDIDQLPFVAVACTVVAVVEQEAGIACLCKAFGKCIKPHFSGAAETVCHHDDGAFFVRFGQIQPRTASGAV